MSWFYDEERERIAADPTKALNIKYVPSTRFWFEEGLPHYQIIQLFVAYWHYTILISFLYILTVFGIQKSMARRKPMNLKWSLFAWNGSLAVFSIFGAIRTLEEVFNTVYYHGLYKGLCYGYEPSSMAAHWYLFFAVSKFVELGDTVFLALRKKPLTFLHCYHHCTVMVYTFHAGSEVMGMGRWFMGMNFIAHSFMYTYYAIMSVGIRLPRGLAKFVTLVQLLQMFVGLAVSLSANVVKHVLHMPCQQSLQNLYLSYAIYASYAVLFLQFFYQRYSNKSKRE
ncbi:unnamed protein product [Bursaphelenchus okinawaensis]|uniref:Elongation of very long chain fatty acids protein n=1 Tax=Bursaphelenchus okinawaensis TaxID=465554 RepID=A0A811LGS1_9BILA|nr:unnamed protein product [Bursaphelenchus okinawaensis]CAG9122096.1 unnamed protein product [Bursaphelenchus okinawaensis]